MGAIVGHDLRELEQTGLAEVRQVTQLVLAVVWRIFRFHSADVRNVRVCPTCCAVPCPLRSTRRSIGELKGCGESQSTLLIRKLET